MVWWNAVSNTAICRARGKIFSAASMHSALGGLCRGASFESFLIWKIIAGVIFTGFVKRSPPCTTRWPIAVISAAERIFLARMSFWNAPSTAARKFFIGFPRLSKCPSKTLFSLFWPAVSKSSNLRDEDPALKTRINMLIKSNRNFLRFNRCDGSQFNNIIDAAPARKVVDWFAQALNYRTDRFRPRKALDKFV